MAVNLSKKDLIRNSLFFAQILISMIKFQRQHSERENASVSPRDILRVVELYSGVFQNHCTDILQLSKEYVCQFMIRNCERQTLRLSYMARRFLLLTELFYLEFSNSFFVEILGRIEMIWTVRFFGQFTPFLVV